MIEAKFQVGLMADAKAIRLRVFKEEQGYENEFDGDEGRAINLVLYLDKKPIGTARLVEIDPETYRVGRVAVLPEYRHHKIGTYLLKFMQVKAKTLGARQLVLGAQLDKTAFYERLGYEKDPTGELFFDEGHPHIMMRKTLKFRKSRRKGANGR
ncbi:MAG: GNAT family N-acetyltransferase [Bacilli bacterium]|jgi:predicted GNAT family N-acyltransferase|nr:GNAT family N-acetyltransferase [Bacilli bacterium]